MRPKLVFPLLLAAAVAVYAVAPVIPGEQSLTLTLPLGDPQAGRQAFLDLGCTSCHRVVGEKNLPMPISAHPGPFLGASLADRDPGELATSIVVPSHHIGEAARRDMEGELSPMGDFSHAMTVRQLTDLVAYLGSFGEG